jgi:hypothetical protein
VIQRQRVDYEVTWSLMRLRDERERCEIGQKSASLGSTFETTIETTGRNALDPTTGGSAPRRRKQLRYRDFKRVGAAGFEPATSRV